MEDKLVWLGKVLKNKNVNEGHAEECADDKSNDTLARKNLERELTEKGL